MRARHFHAAMAGLLMSCIGMGTAAACDGAHKDGSCCNRKAQHADHAQRVSEKLSAKDRSQMEAAVAALKEMGTGKDISALKAERQLQAGTEAAAIKDGRYAADLAKAAQKRQYASSAAGESCQDCCDDCDDCDCAGHNSLDGRTAVLQSECKQAKH